MKKIVTFILLSICAVTISCTDKKQETTTKETIVVPQKTTVIKEPHKSTNVSIDKNGIKVETKKVKVSVQ